MLKLLNGVLLNVTDAVAVGLNFNHVKLLNAAAIADMAPSCCSFHTNSPKIPESSSRRRPRPSKFHPPPNLSKPPSRLAKRIFLKIPTEWYYLKWIDYKALAIGAGVRAWTI